MNLLIKPFWTIKKEPDEELCLKMQKQRLINDMEKTRQAMEDIYANFDNVTDPDLIDCYIYQMNSVFKRYRYLIEQAGKLEVPPVSKGNDVLCEKASAASFVQIDG